MSEYLASVVWKRKAQEKFSDRKYDRTHEWKFDGGVVVPASPSPHVVPAPMSNENNVDPEEAFVASISSCHMLFFLDFASKKRFVVDSYVDNAIGILGEDDEGKTAMTKVTLKPLATFSGDKLPTADQVEQLHHLAHEYCFIANSVKTEVLTDIQDSLFA